MVQNTTAIVGAVALLIGLIFAGIQARALVQQIRTSNVIAGTSELRATINHLHMMYGHLIDYPELRDYFFAGKALLESDPEYRRVLVLAEMLGDAVEVGLFTTRRVAGTEAAGDDWPRFAASLLGSSPVLRGMVSSQWWPYLTEINGSLAADTSGTPSSDDRGAVVEGP